MQQTKWRWPMISHVLSAMLLVPWAAHAELDVLERPAQANVRAANAVMLAISRAGDRLVAVGERGTVILSDDGGSVWRQAKVPVSVSLTKVEFASATHGWAIGHGGVVLHSADGGLTWNVQLDGMKVAQLVHEAASRMSGEVGARFQGEAERLVHDGADKPLLDVHFFDVHHGIVVGAYGLALETTDGGAHWTPLLDRLDNPRGMHLYGIQQIGSRLYVVGEQGSIFTSDDGGKSFRGLKSPYAGSYFGVVGGDSGEVVVFGMRGNVYRSDDGGVTWERSKISTTNALTAGIRSAARLLLADGAGEVHESLDGGRTFTKIKTQKLAPLTGIAQAANGALVISSARGVAHISPNQ